MARAWLIDNVGIATKVRNATQSSEEKIKDYGAIRECPNCHYRIDNTDVSDEWPGLPVGVKFDPSDQQLLDHLAAKCGVGNAKPDMLIDVFIATLEGHEGICYTHPENLPGAKKDGSSVHFFHKTVNAYATGQRKRRKVHCEDSSYKNHVRWHKTGKTKPVMENGVHRGFKKIMVLYKSSNKGSKPDKSNWVMHQFHLGTDEDEKEGEYVVSKIFCQRQKQPEKNDDRPIEDSDIVALQTSPSTPNTNPPNPPRPGRSVMVEDVADDNIMQPSVWKQETIEYSTHVPAPATDLEDVTGCQAWLAGESQAVENSDINCIDDSLLCKEVFNSSIFFNGHGVNHVSCTGIERANNNTSSGAADLENLELDTPPDFQLADLQFGSQDSNFSWIDRL